VPASAKQFVGKVWPELADIVVWVEEKFDKAITEEAAKAVLDAAKGLSTHDMAAELGIGPRTVKHHLMNIFSKMSVGSRTEAVLKALQHGWVSLEGD